MPTQTKVQCANPFCENPVETECAGDDLCAFCEAEERTIIHNYKDECGPYEAAMIVNRSNAKDDGPEPVKRATCEECGDSEQYKGFCEVCQGTGYQIDTTGPNPFDEDEEVDRRRQADADEASRAYDEERESLAQ